MDGFRNIEPLAEGQVCNDPGPPPEILFLSPDQLVVNEDYQRDLSRASIRQIRNMAGAWDWCSFKAPNVARTDDPNIFEVVDGQHTAIAAATNGNVHFLPCLVMSAETLKEKATGFLGINRNRIALTKVAIYGAQVAAQDDTAIAVEAAMSRVGVNLLSMPPSKGGFKVGDTMAVATLLEIAKRGGEDRLATILQIAKEAQAAPISSSVLKALDIALPPDPPVDMTNRVMTVLRGQGVNRLEMICKSRTPAGRRAFETFADTISDMARLPEKRMGRPTKRKTKAPA